jgi:NADPH:quinone reductase
VTVNGTTVAAVVLEQTGGPDALLLKRIELTPPASGEIRVRQTAIGVNYHDIYVRSGLYQTLLLPGIPGIEAVGVVEQLGANVTAFAVGDRIGYVSGGYGAYVEARNIDAGQAIKLPAELGDAPAAASLMKALTVCMLVRYVYRVKRGDIILVHAAAGGVGQLLCNWASHLGATVIGTVGSVEKAALAKAAGAAHIILYREEDVAAGVADISGGTGVSAVYDSVGADTFDASLASLGYEGHLISFGQSSGAVAPFAPSLLATRSLSLSRPIIFHYLRNPDRIKMLADETLAAFMAGVLKPLNPTILPLSKVAEAHRQLEARQSPGGIVLTI